MTRHRFHGDPARFEVVTRFIADRFPEARYVADVASSQGMLTRILHKRLGDLGREAVLRAAGLSCGGPRRAGRQGPAGGAGG